MDQRSLIEILEHRIAPAGVVTATFLGSKLILTGDGDANEVIVSSDNPNSVLLKVGGGTVIRYNGVNFIQYPFDGNITEIEARMGGGDDTLTINSLHGLRGLVVDGGDGLNTTTLTDIDCTGTLNFKGGKDKDVVKFEGDTVTTRAVTTNLGGGDNEVAFSCHLLEVRGLLHIVGGTGNDLVDFSSHIARLSTLDIDAGKGQNAISIKPTTLFATGLLQVTCGNDNDKIEIDPGNLNSTNGIRITPGDGLDEIKITPNNVMMGGGISVFLGKSVLNPATAEISIDSGKINGGITLQGLEGNHTFTVSGAQNPHLGKLTITGGTGNDAVLINGISAQFSQVIMNLGNGTNSATFNTTTLKTAGINYTGGVGTDSVAFSGTNYDLGIVKMKGGGEIDAFRANPGVGSRMQATSIAFEGGIGDDVMELRFKNFSVVNSVQFIGGDGNDSLSLDGDAFSAVGISFNGGAGNDVLTEAYANCNLTGALQFNAGEGNNHLTIGGTAFSATGLNFTGGTGNDIIGTNGTALLVSGKTLFKLGGGTNGVGLACVSQVFNGGLTLNSGAGDDTMEFEGSAFKSGRVTIKSGTGTDIQRFTPSGSLAINGGISVATGTHNGLGKFEIISPNISLFGGVTAQLGDGANDCIIQSTGVVTSTGNLSFRFTGAGSDMVSMHSSGSFQSQGAIQITGLQAGLTARITASEMLDLQKVTITGGIGNDLAWIAASGGAVHGALKVNLGDGANSGIFGPQNGGNLVLDQGATISSKALTVAESYEFYHLTALAPMKIQMGSGTSAVTISNSDLQALSVNLGAGNDFLNLDNANNGIVEIIRGIAKITGGAGDDQIAIGDGTLLGKVDFRSSVLIDGGPGTNDVLSNAGNHYLIGQPKVINFP